MPGMAVSVMKNLHIWIGIGVGLASCDKPAEEADRSKAIADTNPRTRRLERPALENQGTRGRLRASLDAAKKIELPEERAKALLEVGWKALENAPDLTAEALRALPPENTDAAKLIQACVTHWMTISPEQASDWAESLKDTPWMAVAREQIAISLSSATVAPVPPSDGLAG